MTSIDKKLKEFTQSNPISFGDVTLTPEQSLAFILKYTPQGMQEQFLEEFTNNPEEAVQHIFSAQRFNMYALAAENIRNNPGKNQYSSVIDGQTIYRGPTFKELIQARLDDPKLKSQPWLDTVSGVTYQAGTTLAKGNPESKNLILIDKNHTKNALYESISFQHAEGFTFDTQDVNSSKDSKVYHGAQWMGDGNNKSNQELMNKALSQGIVSRFYYLKKPKQDQERALCVYYSGNNSNAGGCYDLYGSAGFLRVD